MDDWDFIDSAPIDGTEILVSDGKEVHLARYWRGKHDIRPEGGHWSFPDGYTHTTGIKLTHWQPKPDPPKL